MRGRFDHVDGTPLNAPVIAADELAATRGNARPGQLAAMEQQAVSEETECIERQIRPLHGISAQNSIRSCDPVKVLADGPAFHYALVAVGIVGRIPRAGIL